MDDHKNRDDNDQNEDLHNPVPGRESNVYSSSWPRLPELALTTSADSQHYRTLDIPLYDRDSMRYHQDDKNSAISDHYSETDTEINEMLTPDHKSIKSLFKDGNSSRSFTKLNEEDTKISSDSTDSLVEAAMDKAEAQDRHVRFHDHVAESAALVQRMLSVKSGHDNKHFSHHHHHHHHHHSRGDSLNPLNDRNSHRDRNVLHEEGVELEDASSTTPEIGSGSVLASLMKLEAVNNRRSTSTKKKKRYSYSGGKKDRQMSFNLKRNMTKSASLLNFPVHSNTESTIVYNSNNNGLRPQRPPLVNRPVSWLSEVASSKYVVPSLQKKKKLAAPSFSRRSSNDSMFTTASQFEPITLEDRIRITFEIANILQKQEFLRKLCRALMLYGCPAHRIEYAMVQVTRTLGVDAEYVYFPNIMLITFNDSTTHTTETHIIRQVQGFEMHRLNDIYRLEKLVAHGEVTIDEALDFIDKVSNQPRIYPLWAHPIAYAVAAFAGCILFFGGRWKEAGVAAALGMIFASNEIFSASISSFQPIWEISVCILIGFVARGIQKYEFCFTPIALSSFIIILPGYPMAVAIIELVSRQLVNGVVRMVYAIIYSFLLGYGISIGSQLYLTMDTNADPTPSEQCRFASAATTCVSSESQWFKFLMVPMFACAFCVWLKAKLPRWPIMGLVAAATYVINYCLACFANAPSQILQVAPAFGLGLIGNLMSKFTGKMSFDAVLLGVFYLVPSSLGLKAAINLFTGTDEVGTQGAGFALIMIETSIGITLGLFLATLIVYPKGTQHTPLMNL